jgi:hypothetical protein
VIEPTVDPSKSQRQEPTVDPSKNRRSIPAKADDKSRRLIPSVKTTSPNGKRVSPPHHTLSISPNRKGGRKLILKTIPSFPSLTGDANSGSAINNTDSKLSTPPLALGKHFFLDKCGTDIYECYLEINGCVLRISSPPGPGPILRLRSRPLDRITTCSSITSFSHPVLWQGLR